MSNRLFKIVAGAAICASVLGVSLSGSSVVLAAGTGPDNAMAPASQWSQQAPGQQTGYAFHYTGDGSQILVRMVVDTTVTPAAFEVWTPEELQQWARGDAVSPVGRGSVDDSLGGDVVWSGSFDTPGTYFVIVTDPGTRPASYALRISGDSVSFPQSNVKAMPVAASSAVPATQAATAPSTSAAPAVSPKVMATKSGMGPGDALAISGKWAPLAIGQQAWYAFPYSGDDSQVTVRMSVDQSSAASFAIWTPDEVTQSAQDSTIQPIGRGAVDDSLGGDLVWSGNFNTPGTYYVVVTQTGPTPANYALTIN